MKNVFIISGPSGAGENSIVNEIEKVLPIEKPVTTTTRAMRQNESQGNPYYFMPKEKFLADIKNDLFFEYAEEDGGNYYGMTFGELERIKKSSNPILIRLDYKGVIFYKKNLPGAVAILIDVPKDVLEHRIRTRDNASDEFIRERMAYADGWYENKDKFDYIIKNEQGKLLEAVDEVRKIILNHPNV